MQNKIKFFVFIVYRNRPANLYSILQTSYTKITQKEPLGVKSDQKNRPRDSCPMI